jgi:hypothetical protein
MEKRIILIVCCLVLIVNVSAEQTVKTVELPLGYIDEIKKNQLHTIKAEFDPPDGVEEIISLEVILMGDYRNNAEVHLYLVNKENRTRNCTPDFYPTTAQDSHSYYFDCTKSAIVNKLKKNFKLHILSTKKMENVVPRLKITYYNKPKTEVNVYGTEYVVGDNGTVFLQLLDNDKLPINNALCYLDVYYPNKTQYIDDGVMVNLAGSDGLYYNDVIVPNATGVYMLSAYCDFIHNLTYLDIDEDSMVYNGGPTQNHGTSPVIAVGHVYASNYYSTFIKLDVNSSYINESLTNVWLYLYRVSGYATDINVTVQRVNETWSESNVTYNNKPSYDPYVWNTTEMTSQYGWTRLDITELYKSWENGTYTNYGMYLNFSSGSNNYKLFWSSETTAVNLKPYVMVSYSDTDFISEIRGSGEIHVSDHYRNIWEYENRTLTEDIEVEINYTELSENVWGYNNRTLTNLSNVGPDITFSVWGDNYTINTGLMGQFVSNVWDYVARYTHGIIT